MSRVDGKTAIVTGTSPNIGGAIARGLAAAGACVLCTGLDIDVAQACADRIVAEGGEAAAIAGDVTDPEHAEQAVAMAVERWGKVDIVVNNAVMFHQQGLLDMPLETFRRQVDISLAGAFLFSRAGARNMIANGTAGSIINILSTAAWQGQPGNIGYTTAKSGLINFTRSAAMELAGHGIRVNGFTPTATQPEDPQVIAAMEAAPAQPSQWQNDFIGQFPMRRLPTPSDYVPSIVFLASDDSSMITGSNITVDGGATAKYWPWRPGAESGT